MIVWELKWCYDVSVGWSMAEGNKYYTYNTAAPFNNSRETSISQRTCNKTKMEPRENQEGTINTNRTEREQ